MMVLHVKTISDIQLTLQGIPKGSKAEKQLLTSQFVANILLAMKNIVYSID